MHSRLTMTSICISLDSQEQESSSGQQKYPQTACTLYGIQNPLPSLLSGVGKKQIENVLRKEIKQNSYLTLGEFIRVCQFSIQILEGITEALEIGLPVSLIVQSGGCDGHLRIVYDI